MFFMAYKFIFFFSTLTTQFGLQESIDTILTKIEELGILDEK